MNHYDIAYGIGAGLSAPLWLVKPSARRKVKAALALRMGKVPSRSGTTPAVMIHAVSLGEINATGELIRRLGAARPGGLHFIISTTTDTGFARGLELYGGQPDITLVRYPLDFSSAVRRLLDRLRPAAVVLMELEVWPNFLRHCRRRDIPVLVINGRLTSASFRRYRLAGPLSRAMFGQLSRICAQDQTYAERFAALGGDPRRITVTGTMKFDTADVQPRGAAAGELAAAMGLKPQTELIWVCGSTGPGEEPIILDVYRRLRERFAQLRLIIVPRKPERFDEVAALIGAGGWVCLRRSQPRASSGSPVILGDTMGELKSWYALAHLVFVGRTLVDLGLRQHGSDMIEPAALGKPVIVGPFTGNFAEPMAKFLEAKAMKVVATGSELEQTAGELLADPAHAADLGTRARQVVLQEQGATDRHVQAILAAMPFNEPPLIR